MYWKLYETWRREVIEKEKLQQLEPNFFHDIGQYLKELIKEIRMLDNKTLKYRILNIEANMEWFRTDRQCGPVPNSNQEILSQGFR